MNRKETSRAFVALVIVLNLGAMGGFYCGDYNKFTAEEYDDDIRDKISTSFFLGAMWGVGYEKHNNLNESEIINELEDVDSIYYDCYCIGKSNSTEIIPCLEYIYNDEPWFFVFDSGV